jgi:hypothetical protein
MRRGRFKPLSGTSFRLERFPEYVRIPAADFRAFDHLSQLEAGPGFPLARIAAVFSLACGAVLDVGICRYAGKGQSELGMLRTSWNMFLPGDVMLSTA